MKIGKWRLDSEPVFDPLGSKWVMAALSALILVSVLASLYHVRFFQPRHRLGQAVRLAELAEEKGDYCGAVKIYSGALELEDLSGAERAQLYLFRGNSLLKIGLWQDSVRDFSQTVRADPGYSKGYNNLAFILAACPERELRDPRLAVDLARRAVRINPTAGHYDTLAAAWAALGDFKQAISTQEKAMEIFRENGADPAVTKDAESRLDLYRSARPYLLDQVETAVRSNPASAALFDLRGPTANKRRSASFRV